MFIAVEGIDGTGKTTVSRLLSEALQALGERVFLTKEPTDAFQLSPELQKSRTPENGVALFFRFTEDRLVHQIEIGEKLREGSTVVTDRFMLSSFAYQGPIIEPIFGSKEKTLEWMNSVSEIVKVRPDIVFLLDLSVEESLKRIENRPEISGFEELNYLKKVREYYLFIARAEERVKVIDASKSIETVVGELIRHVREMTRSV